MGKRSAGRHGLRERIARGPASAKKALGTLYIPSDIIDAPEHHEYARAMGLLTWGPWEAELRPFNERLKDFLQAFPPEAPARFQGSVLAKQSDGEYGPATKDERLRRFSTGDNCFGALAEALARYGLKNRSGAAYVPQQFAVEPFRDVTRLRNQRLRILHGRVDVEADNMDEAKAAEIERLEKKRAAEQIREARERMRQDAK